MNQLVIGVDLGGTNIKSALVNDKGEVLHRLVKPTQASQGLPRVLDEIASCVSELRTRCDSDDVIAVGVGAPGPMNWQTGVVYSPPNLPGWKNVPLADEINERTGLATFVENDANAACWGEYWTGAGRDARTLCCLTLGTGVGGGIVLEGQLLRGPDGTAGELGHLCVLRNGRACNCGARGCLEAYASVTGMVRTAQEGLNNGTESVLRDQVDTLTGAAISEAAAQGDTFARSVIRETGEWVGVGVASLINLLNPDMIVICGGMIEAGDLLFDAIRQTAARQAFDVPAARADIVRAALGQDAGVIGAGRMRMATGRVLGMGTRILRIGRIAADFSTANSATLIEKPGPDSSSQIHQKVTSFEALNTLQCRPNTSMSVLFPKEDQCQSV